MKRYIALIIGTIVLLASNCATMTYADDATDGTGVELMQTCNQSNSQADNDAWHECVMFVEGVYRGAQVGITLRDESLHKDKSTTLTVKALQNIFGVCAPGNETREQMAQVVSKYLGEHPGFLYKFDAVIVISAFKSVWPCSTASK